MSLWSALKSELSGLFNLLLPAACPLCRAELTASSAVGLCPDCLTRLPLLPGAHCPRCALPYVSAEGSAHLCEACLRQPPAFDRVVALGIYDGLLRDGVHRFKFNGAIHLDRPFGALLSNRLEQELPDYRPDLILPVPLHVQRLRQRGYNQSLLLARRLGTRWKIPVAPRRLLRARPTTPQQGLPLTVRQHNLRTAFALTAPLDGEAILLVDDVMTTGATVRECAETLKSGGAGEIVVAVLGRAPRHR